MAADLGCATVANGFGEGGGVTSVAQGIAMATQHPGSGGDTMHRGGVGLAQREMREAVSTHNDTIAHNDERRETISVHAAMGRALDGELVSAPTQQNRRESEMERGGLFSAPAPAQQQEGQLQHLGVLFDARGRRMEQLTAELAQQRLEADTHANVLRREKVCLHSLRFTADFYSLNV